MIIKNIMFSIKINFCESNGFLLRNSRNKFEILNKISTNYDINPLNLYYKIYNSNLENKILSKKTVSCFEGIGKKYLLYLYRFKNVNYSFLIENEISNFEYPRIISIPLIINDKSLFNNSIFTGEMLRFKDKWFFYIDRCIVYKNKVIKKIILSLEKCYDLIHNYKELGLEPFKIRVKEFFNPSNIENKMLNYKNKIIKINFFNEQNYPISFYLNKRKKTFEKFKFKNLDDTTLDLKEKKNEILYEYNNTSFLNNTYENLKIFEKKYIKKFKLILKKSENYGIFNLYDKNNNFISIARVNTIEKRNNVNKSLKHRPILGVECSYDKIFKKFKVNKILEKIENIHFYENIKKYIE
tara:strand:- start:1459 stop:2520 length:1062 start_codon:yes stop_codon:yes gene_type:complete